MKKILIVEDAQDNLDAAKAFFSTIPDFEFVYAPDRERAEDLLSKVNAVITDRQIPYIAGEGIESYNKELLQEMRGEGDNDSYIFMWLQQRQGYAIMAIAHASGLPVVMVSEHGNLMVSCIADNEVVKDIGVGLKSLAPYSRESYKLASELNGSTCRNNLGNYDGITKKERQAWAIAWEKLQEQF